MAERLLKEVYKTPQILVRGVFLCEGIMAENSCWPTINSNTVKYDDFEVGGDVLTQNGEDLLLF
jgi:hypothetical protein